MNNNHTQAKQIVSLRFKASSSSVAVGSLWSILLALLPFYGAVFALGQPAKAKAKPEREDIPLIQTWQGDYPVAELKRLPRQQRQTHVGYFGDPKSFAAVWRAFKPGDMVPAVDFERHLVVFSRNTQYYNRTSIAAAKLRGGVLEVVSRETMSALPIEGKAAMAMAVILRELSRSKQFKAHSSRSRWESAFSWYWIINLSGPTSITSPPWSA